MIGEHSADRYQRRNETNHFWVTEPKKKIILQKLKQLSTCFGAPKSIFTQRERGNTYTNQRRLE